MRACQSPTVSEDELLFELKDALESGRIQRVTDAVIAYFEEAVDGEWAEFFRELATERTVDAELATDRPSSSTGGRLEDMNEKPSKVGGAEIAKAMRSEIKRLLREEPRDHAESLLAVAERLRPELREALVARSWITLASEYPSVERLRKTVAALEDE